MVILVSSNKFALEQNEPLCVKY